MRDWQMPQPPPQQLPEPLPSPATSSFSALDEDEEDWRAMRKERLAAHRAAAMERLRSARSSGSPPPSPALSVAGSEPTAVEVFTGVIDVLQRERG